MMSKRHCDDVRVFCNSTRVCVDPEGEVLALRTYSRERGRHGRFLILREALLEWYAGNHSRAFYDADCGHILELRIYAGIALFQILWLSTDSFGNVYGFKQSFEVPETKLFDLLYENRPVQHLHYDRPRQARIHTERATEMLRAIQSNPLERRAFIKAMRDCFQWRDEEVYLYPDWCNSFYFETKSGYPSCGGLIRHDTTVRTPNGLACKFYYSVHT